MTKEDFLKNAKIIFVDNTLGLMRNELASEHYFKYKWDIDKFLFGKAYLRIGSNDEKDFYRGVDYHHYTTEFWIKNLPLIAAYLNVPFNINDFVYQEKRIGEEIYGHLVPRKNTMYRFINNANEIKGEAVIFLPLKSVEEGDYSSMIYVDNIYNRFWPYTRPYHKLFKYIHENTIIENTGENTNGRTLILNCNSHIAIVAPVLSYYYRKVIILDNRFVNDVSLSYFYENEDINNSDCVIMMSYDDEVAKFTQHNLD